jgi:uncharacterized membrane protein
MARSTRSGHWSRDDSETEFARVVAFSDGVIAIAITLLVLNFDVPEVPDERLSVELAQLWPSLISYAISFIVIGALWVQHHSFFGQLRSFDSRLMVLNLAYLSLIVLVPFTTDVLDNYGDVPAGPILYAVVLAGASLIAWVMGRYAIGAGFVPAATERGPTTGASLWGLVPGAIFMLSVPLALVVPQYTPLAWLAGFLITSRRSP